MAILLNIDCSTDSASVCLSENENSLACLKNENQREHASFVITAVKELTSNVGIGLNNIDAFAVTSGPGSYTGLRVGMATAKGFCYALSKPLVTVNTLEVMVLAAKQHSKQHTSLFCPMIDARRMEVFTALYDAQNNAILEPSAVILNEDFLRDQLIQNSILFFGNGSNKLKAIVESENACFEDIFYDAEDLAVLAYGEYKNEHFADFTYSQPNYFKSFFSTKLKNQ